MFKQHKVYSALNFLCANNPEYADVTISNNVDLPNDDVPSQIMDMLETYEDCNTHRNSRTYSIRVVVREGHRISVAEH